MKSGGEGLRMARRRCQNAELATADLALKNEVSDTFDALEGRDRHDKSQNQDPSRRHTSPDLS